MKFRVITWNMQGGGTSASVNESAENKLKLLLEAAPSDDRINVFCLQENGGLNTTSFLALNKEKDETLNQTGVFEVGGRAKRRFYYNCAAGAGDSNPRCTNVLMFEISEKSGIGKIGVPQFVPQGIEGGGRRPSIVATLGSLAFATMHCLANQDAYTELKATAAEFFKRYPLGLMGGDFNKTPPDMPVTLGLRSVRPTSPSGGRNSTCIDANLLFSGLYTHRGGTGKEDSEIDYFIVGTELYKLMESKFIGTVVTGEKSDGSSSSSSSSSAPPPKNYSDHDMVFLLYELPDKSILSDN